MVICSHCGEKNSDTQKFCSKCGKKLNSDNFSDELKHKINSLEQEQEELLIINNGLKEDYKLIYDESQENLKINDDLNKELDMWSEKNNAYTESNDDLDSKISKIQIDNEKISNENNILIDKIGTKTKKIILVCLTLILCSALVAGGLLTMNDGFGNQEINDYATDNNNNSSDVSVSSSDNNLNETKTYQKNGEEFKTFDFGGLFEMDLPSNGTLYEHDLNAGRYNSYKSWYYIGDYGEISIYYWENENINDIISYLLYKDDENLYSKYKDNYEVRNESDIIVLNRDSNSRPIYGVIYNSKIIFIESDTGDYCDSKSDEIKNYLSSIKF